MMDDPVTNAAAKAKQGRIAITKTTDLIRKRMDPKLIVADLAKLVLARAIARAASIRVTPKQRKRAVIGAGIAAATAIGMRVLYRNANEKPSPEAEEDVKRLE